MNKAGTVAALALLLLLVTTSLIMVKPASAQSIPEPSVPQFTIQLIDRPYSVPGATPTYTIDPYTGEQKQVSAGYPERSGVNRYIEIDIRNTQYILPNGTALTVYYNVRTKGHFEQQGWQEKNAPFHDVYGGTFISKGVPVQSNSELTVLSFTVDDYPTNAQIDFQVSAMVGAQSEAYFYPHIGIFQADSEPAIALVSQSAWSDTQTISLSSDAITVTPSPNPTATITPTNLPAATPSETPKVTSNPTGVIPAGVGFDFSWLEVAIFVVVGIVVALLVVFIVLLRRRIRVLELKHSGA